jgi:TatA/E family protein of Tat protein translocase
LDLFGVGPLELVLILIVAMVVLGPDRLPEVGARLGRGVRDMRRATRALTDELNATKDAIEQPLKPVIDAANDASSLARAASNPSQALRDSVMKELAPVAKEANAVAAEVAAAGAAVSETVAGATAAASLEPPSGAAFQHVIRPPAAPEITVAESGDGSAAMVSADVISAAGDSPTAGSDASAQPPPSAATADDGFDAGI